MAWTWLEKVGHDIVSFFGKAAPIISEVQTVAAPFEAILFPGLPAAISATLAGIANAEALGVTAASTDPSGNNAAKLASVIAAVTPQIQPIVTAAGFQYDSPSATTFVNAIVAAANAFKQAQVIPVPVASVPTPAAPVK